jgi:hypothetical protein
MIACAAAAAVALALGALLGDWLAGGALAAGLVIGTSNGFLARRGLGSGLPMTGVSLARLVLLSSVALGVGLLFGLEEAWLAVLGLAAAQLLLAASAVVEMARR